ncbi:MAG: hypothetical protein R3A12_02340 [Ignavibacteria bacterium]
MRDITLRCTELVLQTLETGYMAGSIDIQKTTNGGINWINVYSSTTNEIFTDIVFTDPNIRCNWQLRQASKNYQCRTKLEQWCYIYKQQHDHIHLFCE